MRATREVTSPIQADRPVPAVIGPVTVAGLALVASLLVVVVVRYPAVVLPGLVCAGILLSRPSVVGERYPALGPALVCVGAVCCGLVTVRRRQTGDGSALPYALFAAVWIWLLLRRVAVPHSEPNVVTSTLTVFLPVMAFMLVTRNRQLLGQVRDCLVTAITAVSALMTLSVLAMLVVGPAALTLGTVPLGYADSGVSVVLPGVFSYGADPGSLLPRLLGLGREPGVGALFIGWAYFAMSSRVRRRGLWRAVLVVSLLATQSTAGIGLFGVCLVLSLVVGSERFSPARAVAASVGAVAAAYAIVFTPVFGLAAKMESGNSYTGRVGATLNGLAAATEHPLTTQTLAPLSAVNLVASTAVSGLPWFLLLLAFLVAPVLRAGRRDPMAYGSLFVFLVVLLAQPVTGSTAFLLLVLVSYYSVGRTSDRRPEAATPRTVPAARPGHPVPNGTS